MSTGHTSSSSTYSVSIPGPAWWKNGHGGGDDDLSDGEAARRGIDVAGGGTGDASHRWWEDEESGGGLREAGRRRRGREDGSGLSPSSLPPPSSSSSFLPSWTETPAKSNVGSGSSTSARGSPNGVMDMDLTLISAAPAVPTPEAAANGKKSTSRTDANDSTIDSGIEGETTEGADMSLDYDTGSIDYDDYSLYEYGSSIAGGGGGGTAAASAAGDDSVDLEGGKGRSDRCGRNGRRAPGNGAVGPEAVAAATAAAPEAAPDVAATSSKGANGGGGETKDEEKNEKKKKCGGTRSRRVMMVLLVLLGLIALGVVVVSALKKFAGVDVLELAGLDFGFNGSTRAAGVSSGAEEDEWQGVSDDTPMSLTLNPYAAPSDRPSSPAVVPTISPTTESEKKKRRKKENGGGTFSVEAREEEKVEPSSVPNTTKTTDEPAMKPITFAPTLSPTYDLSPTASPSTSPSTSFRPTMSPTQYVPPFDPGNLTGTSDDGKLILSSGLSATVLIESRTFVVSPDGVRSEHKFHNNVRAGATFPLPDNFGTRRTLESKETATTNTAAAANGKEEGGGDVAVDTDEKDGQVRDSSEPAVPKNDVDSVGIPPPPASSKATGGYVYVSNSHLKNGNGGTGVVHFDEAGLVLNYSVVLDNMNEPGGGGPTPWGTWITLEEGGSGTVWEVDPFGRKEAIETVLSSAGVIWGGVAYDDREKDKTYFFLTEYDTYGPIRRYTLSNDAVKSNDDKAFRFLAEGGGTMEYLVWIPDNNDPSEVGDGNGEVVPPSKVGRVVWTDNEKLGRAYAEQYFRNCRGIARHGSELYFVSEEQRELMVVDLDDWTFRAYSTAPILNGVPDEVVVLGESSSPLLLVTDRSPPASEDGSGGGGGVAMIDPSDGSYSRVLSAEDSASWVTGLAFSPDGTRMYAALNDGTNKNGPNLLYSVTRDDGKAFFNVV